MVKKVAIVFAIITTIYILSKLLKGSNVINKAANIIADFEGFVAKPYWDFKQWTWGYGTKVPDSVNNPNVIPNKRINKDEAFNLLGKYVAKDYDILKPLVKKVLTPNQWAALLSFSYNLGSGSAKNIVSAINSGASNLESKWKSYIYAGGSVNSGLVSRRNTEWNLYNS